MHPVNDSSAAGSAVSSLDPPVTSRPLRMPRRAGAPKLLIGWPITAARGRGTADQPGISIWIFTSVSRPSAARSKAAMLSSKGRLSEISGFRSTLPAAISAMARS